MKLTYIGKIRVKSPASTHCPVWGSNPEALKFNRQLATKLMRWLKFTKSKKHFTYIT